MMWWGDAGLVFCWKGAQTRNHFFRHCTHGRIGLEVGFCPNRTMRSDRRGHFSWTPPLTALTGLKMLKQSWCTSFSVPFNLSPFTSSKDWNSFWKSAAVVDKLEGPHLLRGASRTTAKGRCWNLDASCCLMAMTVGCEGTVNSHICSPVQADRIKCYWHGCSTTCMMMQPLLGNPAVLHPRNLMQGQQGACYIYRASRPQHLATAIQSQNHDAVLDILEPAQEPDSYGFIAATRRREPVLLTAASCGYFHSVSLLLECLGEPKHFMPWWSHCVTFCSVCAVSSHCELPDRSPSRCASSRLSWWNAITFRGPQWRGRQRKAVNTCRCYRGFLAFLHNRRGCCHPARCRRRAVHGGRAGPARKFRL